MSTVSQKVAIGQIGKCVGLKGEVRVIPLTHRVERFKRLDHVWIGIAEDDTFQKRVLAVRSHKNEVILQFEAEELRGKFIYVEEDGIELPPAGSYFIHDLVGLTVYDEAGNQIGVLKDVVAMSSNDIWVVQNGDREILIPAVKEFVRKVDVEQGIVIRVIEGLVSNED
jgi:16S rRNA processing protein RimM